MKSPMIFHSVNAGLFLFCDGIGVAVDALHEGRAVGCSPMPEQLARESETGAGLFTHVTGTLFTHLHQDHFDRDRL